MKVFKKERLPNGKRYIYLFGMKIFSYRKHRFPVPYIDTKKIDKKIAHFNKIGTNQAPRNPRIIVSMTSFPQRMVDVHYAIFSLLNQTLKPDEIILWLGRDEFPNRESDLPKTLLNLCQYGLCIKWCRDVKSYTKLVPALQEYPNDIIITVDDDIYYPNYLVEKLYSSYKNHPNMIHCMRAHRISFDDKNNIKPYNDWPQEIQNVLPGFSNFPTGVGGVLYPPHCLDSDVINEKLFMKLAPHADDIWFWAMAVKNKTMINVVSSDYKLTYINPKRQLGMTNETTLSTLNVLNKKNDSQIRAVTKHLKLPMDKLANVAKTKVSIIVPVYNVEQFLPQCMESLINQTLQEIEIICVNDGSTDESEKILNQYAKRDKRIDIITQQNMGLSAARNTGLALATGEYVCFVDSDDWVDTDWCEKLYTRAKSEHADIARGMIYNEYPNKTEPHEFNPTIKHFAGNNLHLGKNDHCVVVWNSIYKRKFLTDNHINFIVGLVHEDIPWTAQTTYYAHGIVPIDNTFYHYRQKRAGQLSERNMKSVIGTFMANHHAITFINSVKYKHKHDYINAIKRIIWRTDNTFIYAIQNLDDFSDDLVTHYFNLWQNDLLKCKYIDKCEKDFPWIRYVIRGNLKKYTEHRVKN